MIETNVVKVCLGQQLVNTVLPIQWKEEQIVQKLKLSLCFLQKINVPEHCQNIVIAFMPLIALNLSLSTSIVNVE